MKTLLQTVAVAFSLYSRIPVPRVEWNAKNMRYALCALPFVGAVTGLLLGLWGFLCRQLAIGIPLWGAGVALLPVAVTGGIHLDGFCDTCDALASHAERERKLAIMKDSHAGAFAILGAVCYFLLYFGLACEAERGRETALCLGLGMMLLRALAGLAMCRLPCAKDSGLAHAFADAAAKRGAGRFLAALALLLAVLLCLLAGPAGALCLAAAALAFLGYRRMALGQFGGITGDLQGWFVQMGEVLVLAALVMGQKIW